MKNMITRLGYLFLAWGIVGCIYKSSYYLQFNPTILPPSFIDNMITFTPHAIWAYLSFFVIIPLCFLTAPYQKIGWMSLSFIGCAILAGLCYVIWPTMVESPTVNNDSMSTRLLNKLINVDVNYNCFPSLHVALTLIVAWGTISRKHPIYSLILIIWAGAICLSIIQLRRHLFIDFLGGGILAFLVGSYLPQAIILCRKAKLNRKENI